MAEETPDADDVRNLCLARGLAPIGRELGLGGVVKDWNFRKRWRFSKNEERAILEEFERRRGIKHAEMRRLREAAAAQRKPKPIPARSRRAEINIHLRSEDPLDLLEASLFRIAHDLTQTAVEIHKAANYLRGARMQWLQDEIEQAREG